VVNIARGRFARSENLLDALKKMMSDSDRRRRDEILVATKRRRPAAGKRRKRGTAKKPAASRKERKPVLFGLFQPGTVLRAKHKGTEYTSTIDAEGKIHLGANVFNSPSMAAIDIAGHPKDGWLFWRYKNEKGEWVLLDELRRKRIEQGPTK